MCTRGRVLKKTMGDNELGGASRRVQARAADSSDGRDEHSLRADDRSWCWKERPTRDSDGHRWSYTTILTRAGRSGCGTQPEARRAKREIWWCKVKISSNFFAHACGIADVAGDVDTDVMAVAN